MTFFLLGSWADDYMEEVQKIYDAGHEIGNHSYSHKDMPSMNYEDIMLDIQKCNETVRNITEHSPTLFRAPSEYCTTGNGWKWLYIGLSHYEFHSEKIPPRFPPTVNIIMQKGF